MRIVLVLLDIFLAVSGLVGGKALTRDPTGRVLHMPVNLLKDVPLVRSYLWPGVFLLLAYTLGGSVAAMATLARVPWADRIQIGLGVVLLLWLLAEFIFIPRKHAIQIVFFLIGISLVILPLL